MSLRTKVLLIVIGIFVVFIAADLVMQRLVILPSFISLEQSEAKQDYNRALSALEREIESVHALNSDWSGWDDTYQFMQDRNTDYLRSNFNEGILEQIGMNIIVFYDLDHNVAVVRSVNPNDEQPFKKEALEQLIQVVGTPTQQEPVIKGLVLLEGVPLLIAAMPILTSELEGPSRGTLIMASHLSQNLIERLSEQANVDLNITVIPVNEGKALSGEINAKQPKITSDKENITFLSPLANLNGRPILNLNVTVPKDISARGANATKYASMSLAGAGIIVLLSLLFVLDRLILRPTVRLTEHAKTIGDADGMLEPLELNRSDELGVLAEEFDLMMERLADARRQLTKQSHAAGVAEMASGVLHNIGNAITPVNLHLVDAMKTVKQFPKDDINLAVSRIGTDNLSAEQVKLVEFLKLAGQVSEETLATLHESINRASTHLGHVQRILASHAQFSRAEKVYDTVQLKALLDEAISMLGHEIRERLAISYDSSVDEFGKLTTASVTLIQIIANIAINADEAVGRMNKNSGNLTITATRAAHDEVEVAHLAFTDDGCGISAADLPHLFERGFSTKNPKPSGLGLHWCSNMLVSLGGEIRAESEGEGLGATIHLTIPTTPPKPATS